MAKVNQIISIMKYDYRYLYFFNNQINSLKEQFIHKYDKKDKYQLFLITKEKNQKRLRKKKYYENLYLRNKYIYYIIFTEKVMSKYVRKQLYKDLLGFAKSIVVNIILEYLGIRKKLSNFLAI